MELSFELPLVENHAPDFDSVPDVPGALIVHFEQGDPYLARTARLRRRLRRLLAPVKQSSFWAGVRHAARQVFYQPTGSAFESAVLLYHLARRHRPENYRWYLRLRTPPFVKVQLANEYPRTYITSKLTGRRALFFGPFVSRVAAERFESAFLDLFKIRRCSEEIKPDPAHPGCIYGEMEMCLRPCQARCSLEDYRSETGRVIEFLDTRGSSLVAAIGKEREAASIALEFEEAARQHTRLQRVHETMKQAGDLAREIDGLFGAVIQPSFHEEAVEISLVYKGFLQASRTFALSVEDGKPVSLDRKLRETLAAFDPSTGDAQERADHLALLSRWYHSSWRSGEIVLFDRMDHVPYRRLVNAISRVQKGRSATPDEASPKG
jgi:excinuclease UvrABC nuclease subunit